ncbi:MAG TPA: AMP-binding protein [Limnochordales bacterium]|nr:AMP-binding protein [Limnochordales bacterium]
MYRSVSDAQFASFLAAAYREAPAVRRLLDEAGVRPDSGGPPEAVLPRLPVTAKEELSAQQRADAPFGGWVAGGVRGVRRVFVSPGPIHNVEGLQPDDWGTGEAFRAAGFGPGDLVLNTFSYHLSPAGFIVEAGAFAVGAAVVPAGTMSRAEQVRLLRQLPVTGFAGVPSYLRALLETVKEEAAAAGGTPRLALRRAWFTAEKLDEDFRRELAEGWGVAGFQGYGTAEVGVVAYECEAQNGMHLGGRVVVEVLDPETRKPVPEGEVGELVVTALRPAYPLLRLATGDLSRVLSGPCPCGRPTPRIAGVLGRVGAGVKVRGMFIYPHQIQELARAVPGVVRLAARVDQQGHRDRLLLDAEIQGGDALEPGAADALKAALAAEARDRLRVRPDAVALHPAGSLADRPPLEDVRQERAG